LAWIGRGLPHPQSFPYTTLFRSRGRGGGGVRRARAALAAAALAVGLAACGIPADDEPRAIPEEQAPSRPDAGGGVPDEGRTTTRSEEHTSELQSRENLVCRLLLE